MISNQDLIQALERISNWGDIFCPQDTYWRTGMNNCELNTMIKGFSFALPKELSLLYQCNYADIDISPEFCSVKNLCSNLDDCLRFWLSGRIPDSVFIALIKKYLDFYEGCFENEVYQEIIKQYPLNWCEFPIGYGGAGEVYFVKIYKHETETSPVWVRFKGENPVEYGNSLTNLMLAFAECYESGAYYPVWVKDDDVECWDIEMDLERVEIIFKKYNPLQIDTWKMIHIGSE